ncbi:MAG: ATP-binding cassette domain-containing protein [Clostridia bacterium]|nr:ATP-binding cassette domain-containing protein [Clostridia bacterium]
MLKLTNLSKEFKNKVALANIDVVFPQNGLVIIKGESGSGKTTLLNMLTANDFPTCGTVEFNGAKITRKNAEDYRRVYCSSIYQDYMLIEDMTVGENIQLAMQACGIDHTLETVKKLLEKVRIDEDYIDKKTAKLSGGEKQRVAIARALAKTGAMIFADEPTGNLDSKNGEIIMELLKEISKDRLVVVVSHNEKYNKKYGDYTIELVDGEIVFCDAPAQESDKNTSGFLNKKSKLSFKSLAKLAYWGFEKNKVKSIASIIAFVALCIMSVISLTLFIGDFNLLLARNLDIAENKNVKAELVLFQDEIDGSLYIDRDALIDYYDKGSEKFSLIYKLKTINVHDYYFDQGNPLEFKDAFIRNFVIYDKEVGADVDVICGDFPKAPNQIMLPSYFAQCLLECGSDFAYGDLQSLVGKNFYIFTSNYALFEKERFCNFEICGIFDEGVYLNDFENLSADEKQYIVAANWLGECAFFGEGAEYVFLSNPDIFVGDSRFTKPMSVNLQEKLFEPYGYDEYSIYAKEFTTLNDGEIYVGANIIKYTDAKVGDIVNISIGKRAYSAENFKENFTGKFLIKGVLEKNGMENSVVFSRNDYVNDVVFDEDYRFEANGMFFNLKDVKNAYSFFVKMENDCQTLCVDEYSTDMSERVFTQTTKAIVDFHVFIRTYKYFLLLPVTLLSIIGMLALGLVSFGYLVSAKDKSYNILRSIGFGKRSIATVIFVQIFTVVLLEIVIGLILSKIAAIMLGRSFLKLMVGGVFKNLWIEELVLLGYASPIIVITASVLIGTFIIMMKTTSLFSKSIMENKTK